MVRMLFFLPSVQHVEFNVDTSTRYKGTPTQQGTPREFLRRWQYHHLHHVCLHLGCRHSLCACNLWRELITSTSETIRGKGSQQNPRNCDQQWGQEARKTGETRHECVDLWPPMTPYWLPMAYIMFQCIPLVINKFHSVAICRNGQIVKTGNTKNFSKNWT